MLGTSISGENRHDPTTRCGCCAASVWPCCAGNRTRGRSQAGPDFTVPPLDFSRASPTGALSPFSSPHKQAQSSFDATVVAVLPSCVHVHDMI